MHVHVACIYAKLSFIEDITIADSAHVSGVKYVLRFIEVTNPNTSSRFIHFQVVYI